MSNLSLSAIALCLTTISAGILTYSEKNHGRVSYFFAAVSFLDLAALLWCVVGRFLFYSCDTLHQLCGGNKIFESFFGATLQDNDKANAAFFSSGVVLSIMILVAMIVGTSKNFSGHLVSIGLALLFIAACLGFYILFD